MPSKSIQPEKKPRFRMFAGPNGSGKSTLFNFLKNKRYISTELYINADKVERQIKETKAFHFNAYRVKVSDAAFKTDVRSNGLYAKSKLGEEGLSKLNITSGVLYINLPIEQIDSYIASFICTYLVKKLIQTNTSFCYETVMSHESKLDFFDLAKEAGYATYLYFVTTSDWTINKTLIALRVANNEHDVNEDKIEPRYIRSMGLLHAAIDKAQKAFVFDNSELDFALVAAYESNIRVDSPKPTPEWLIKYLS